MSRPKASGSGGAEIKNLMGRLTGLPAFSTTAIRLLALATDLNEPIEAIESVFRADPKLTADLLVVANSALFGFPSRVATIRHALALLGLDRVRALAATVSISGYTKGGCSPEARRSILGHAIATGVIAEQLVRYAGGASGPLLYTAALMHDIGRLGLLRLIGEAYEAHLATDFSTMGESEDAERKLCGMTHTEAGGVLSRTWGFPRVLSDCAQGHHSSTEQAGDEVRVVQAACTLAGNYGYPELHVQCAASSTLAELWHDALEEECLHAILEETLRVYLG